MSKCSCEHGNHLAVAVARVLPASQASHSFRILLVATLQLDQRISRQIHIALDSERHVRLDRGVCAEYCRAVATPRRCGGQQRVGIVVAQARVEGGGERASDNTKLAVKVGLAVAGNVHVVLFLDPPSPAMPL